MILTKPTNFSNIKYPYPNLTQIKSTDLTQITFLLKIFAMDIFFQINLLLLQSLNKNPIQNNLPPLHSLKKKKPSLPSQHPNFSFTHNNNLHNYKSLYLIRTTPRNTKYHGENQRSLLCSSKSLLRSFTIIKRN